MVARLYNLESRFESAERQRTTPLAELDDLRSRCSDLELLESQHQGVSHEHTELTHKYEQVTDHEQRLQQQHQKMVAQQDQQQLELSEAEELQRETLAELEHIKQVYVTDVHRLQDEVLSLEDQLSAAKLDFDNSKDHHDKQLQQQSREALEHHNKAVQQISEYNSKHEAGLQEQLNRQEAKRDELVSEIKRLRQVLDCSVDNVSDLQQRLIDCSSNLTRCQDWLEASELRCSELEQALTQSRASQCDALSQLATLQADLKILHDLTAGSRLTAEDLFHLFAKPVSSEDSGHSLEESGATRATAAATAASDNSDTEQAPGDGGEPCNDRPQETSDSNTALASGALPGSEGTPEASAAAPDSAAETAANSSGRHMHCGTGSNKAIEEACSSWPAGETLLNIATSQHC